MKNEINTKPPHQEVEPEGDLLRGLSYALPLSMVMWGFILLGLAWVSL